MRVIMKENFLVHVAQLDRVLPSEGKGREFDSRRGHQWFIKCIKNALFMCESIGYYLSVWLTGGVFFDKIKNRK